MTKISMVIGAKELKEFVNSLSMLEDFNFDVRNDGIYVHAMDNNSISMVKTGLPKKVFSKWKVAKGHITVQGDSIREALKNIKDKDKISINTSSGANPKLILTIGKEKREIPYNEVPSKAENKEPNVEFTARITVPAKELKEAINKAKKINKYALFIIGEKKLILFAKGETHLRMELPIEGEVKKTTTMQLNMDYLAKMLKAAGKETPIKLEMKTDEPMRVSYNTGNTDAKYWLAPYINDDNSELIKEALHPAREKKRERLRA